MSEIDLDIERLHAAYAKGVKPIETIDAVYRRIAAVADPGIFITLVDEADEGNNTKGPLTMGPPAGCERFFKKK